MQEIQTDTINEKTLAAGVTIDSVLLIDNTLTAAGITVTDILADTIFARTLGGYVTINGVLCKDSIIYTDTINEKTAATGVTIDSVLLIDNKVICGEIRTDLIIEKTGANGVEIEATRIKDGGITLITTGGTAAPLNYYEEFTHVTTWSGASLDAPVSGNVIVTRIGRVCNITIPLVSGVANPANPASGYIMNTAFPTKARPSANLNLPVRILDGGVFKYGMLTISTLGAISVGVDAIANVFASTGTNSIYALSMTYNV